MDDRSFLLAAANLAGKDAAETAQKARAVICLIADQIGDGVRNGVLPKVEPRPKLG